MSSSSNVFVLPGILVHLHRGQQIICLISCVSGIMNYRGLCEFLDTLLAPFSLLASVLAGTGNSTKTLRYCILEQNNCFFLASNDAAVSFLAFCGVQTIKETCDEKTSF